MAGEVFIQNLGLMIAAAALFSLAARRFRFPSIVAHLLAGLLLGPLTGLVEITDSVALISEAGIVLLLFLVGLELNFDKIKGMGKTVLLAGLGQLCLTASGGFLIAWVVGFSPAHAAFFATALTFSSTVLVVKLLEEKHQLDRLYGRLAIGILLLQDLAVIVVLTLLTGLGAESSFNVSSLGWGLLKAFGGMSLLVAMVLLASRYCLSRPFAWAARSPATLMIWSLGWCFLVVSVAHWLHLSEEIGAFLAGLALAQLPYNQDLQRRVHPLMNFFVAVFFVSLGIQIQLGPALAEWPLVLLFSAYALVGKFVILMGLLARRRLSERTAFSTAMSLSQISEFSLILGAACMQIGLIDINLFSLLALVGLVTFCLSAFGMQYVEALYAWMHDRGWLRRFGAREQPEPEEEDQSLKGHVIVVGINTLGNDLVRRLHAIGESVLAVDTDPHKLSGLPCPTLIGNVEYLSVLEEAGLPRAKLLVSALQIETTNDLLAFRCQSFGVPSSILVVDLSVTDNLLDMDVSYLMIPKIDGIKLQTNALRERGILKA